MTYYDLPEKKLLDYYKKFGFNKIGKKFEFYGPVDINRVLMKKLKAELNSIKKYKFS